MFSHPLRYGFVGLLAGYSFLNTLLIEARRYSQMPVNGGAMLLLFGVITLLVWEGNRLLEVALARRSSLTLSRRIAWQFGGGVLITTVSAVLPTLLLVAYLGIPLTWAALHLPLKLILVFAFRINLFLNGLNVIFIYLRQLRKTQLEAEKFRKASAQAQFAALRNQINPHFLFNSLSVLATLTEQNPPAAAAFIQQFARVYRYVIQHHGDELVPLRDEMTFIGSYLYLLQQRFGTNLRVQVRVQPAALERYVMPVSLQMLIENAVKHNVISQQHPLQLDVFDEEARWLVVRNAYQPKTPEEGSTRIGLSNIRQRYAFVSAEAVEVIQDEESFTVRIPLIRLDPAASSISPHPNHAPRFNS